MPRWIAVLVTPVVLFGCVALGAQEPPQISRDGDVAPSERTTFEELGLEVTDLAIDLDTPWDLVWGPDGWIWFTERPGRVSRVDPETGERHLLAEIPTAERGESGLLGMELHPDFPGTPYVYLMQSYTDGAGITNRLLRYTFEAGALRNREVLLDDILGNTYHDGSRLAFGPSGYLYVTTGDAGRPRIAQDTGSLNGKVLRLTAGGEPAPGNPFGNEVFSYGHRNAQGLVFRPESDELYITEHGPDDNDEVAIVGPGQNHGWPQVHGFCDDDNEGESEFCTQHDVTEPIAAWTPTIAPAGADFYDSGLIAGWRGSFLFVTLKGSALYRLELSGDGRRVRSQTIISQGRYGRLRDVLVGPDGVLYIATSNRDGRGNPEPNDDRILMIRPER